MADILPGFREFYPTDCFARNYIFSKMRHCCENFGFLEYDAPILEPLELFTEKSGEEIVSQLFSFSDRGGRAVAMRPEMTPAVARMVGSKINTLKKPIKWFSIEENFRYERPQKGRLRSFYQCNIDIFGESGPVADAEVIALSLGILQNFGLTFEDVHLRLSDRTLWIILLENFDITQQDLITVLAIIDKMEREPEESILEKLSKVHHDAESLYSTIKTFQKLRSLEEIEAFFKKILHSKNDSFGARLQELKELLSRLNSFGLGDFITLDFGIVRGLAYYTGFVFEIFERSGKNRALAGGGRYDNLVEKMGFSPTSAVGLAIGDVTLLNFLQGKDLIPEFLPISDIFVIYDEKSEQRALHDIHSLRLGGLQVGYVLKNGILPEKQFKQASGSRFLLTYREDKDKIILKNIESREETIVEREELLKTLKTLLGK